MTKIIGNEDTLSQITIAGKSAIARNKAIPHMLLSGAAGCGKTTTARFVASRIGSDFINLSYDAIKKRSDVVSLIHQLDATGYDKYGVKVDRIRPTVIFIDEIHGLGLVAQEYLGILMEELKVSAPVNEIRRGAPANRNIEGIKGVENESADMWAPEFTLIGATTNDGKLSKPFRDRFKLRFVFTPYPLDKAGEIVEVHAERLGIQIDERAVYEIAKRGRGVPRILVTLLERCQDIAIVSNSDVVTYEVTKNTFERLGVDNNGLTRTDIELLKALNEVGEPVGLENLAVRLNESQKVLSETLEPYLIQQGLIVRLSRGRKITEKGIEYLSEHGHIGDQEEKDVVHVLTPGLDRRL